MPMQISGQPRTCRRDCWAQAKRGPYWGPRLPRKGLCSFNRSPHAPPLWANPWGRWTVWSGYLESYGGITLPIFTATVFWEPS